MKRIGPVHDVIEAEDDRAAFPILWMGVECLGTDGKVHMASASTSPEAPSDVVESFYRALEAVLTNRMRELGVWGDE